jgi:hypothetical protein
VKVCFIGFADCLMCKYTDHDVYFHTNAVWILIPIAKSVGTTWL